MSRRAFAFARLAVVVALLTLGASALPAAETARTVYVASNWASALGPLRPLWNAWKADEASKGTIWDDEGHITSIAPIIVSSFRADSVPASAVAYMVAHGASAGMLVAGNASTAATMASQENERVRAANAAAAAAEAAAAGTPNQDQAGGTGPGGSGTGDPSSSANPRPGDPPGGAPGGDVSPAPDSEGVPTLNPAAALGDRANIKYGTDHPLQVLDLYYPPLLDPATAKAPLVVYFHGGGFSAGDKSNVSDFLPLLDHGYALASVNYRLLQKSSTGDIDIMKDVGEIAKQAFDARKAVRWLRDNAAKYGLDPNRFAAVGASAGGYLAAVVGAAGGVASLPNESPGSSTSAAVKAVVDWCGPTNFATFLDHKGSGTGFPTEYATAALNSQGAISPYDYAGSGDPPHLIRHGEADPVVPYQQSTTYAEKLKGAGVKVDLKTYPGLGHEPSREFLDAEVKAVTAFLDANLR